MCQYIKLSSIRTLEEAEKMHSARVNDAKWIWEKYSDSFKKRNCPICGGEQFTEQAPFHGTFKIDLCMTCNTPFCNPAPSMEALNDFYTNGLSNKILNDLYKKRAAQSNSFISDIRIDKIIQLIKQFPSGKTINVLEIGCNQGSFLSKLNKEIKKMPDYELDLYGVDIDEVAISMNTDPKLTLIHGWAEALCKKTEWQNKFDIVVHFELIEHLVDPSLFMQSLLSLMKAGAYMLFSTPNMEGLEIKASHYNDYRLLAHTIVPPLHINSFSTTNIMHFALRHNYAVLEIATPGKLDVDCVNLYSKYAENIEPLLHKFELLDDELKGWLQALIIYLNASSSMMVLLKKQ